jgi:phage terminase large subunit-like protein
MTDTSEIHRKRKSIELLERKRELQEGLPHLHGFKLYQWQREFLETREKTALLCAGNQIGKSSANILKWIHWATEPKLWPILWPNRRPKQFWMLLPTKDMIQTEFLSKYEPEFLPKGQFKKKGQYSWAPEFRNRYLWAIHFLETDISIFMHTYAQETHHLQAGTVDAIFVDEEPPWELMPELLMRIAATNGYFNAVMTPTMGQEQWRRAFEVKGDGEVFQGAFKRRVSVFDCLHYEDGSRSNWTEERINQMMNRLSSQQEIDLRIYGRFVAQEGLRISAFNQEKNLKPPSVFKETDWFNYAGVDIGSGGKAHPPAIVFVAVRSDYQRGFVTKVWRGDKNRNYTVTDIIDQYMAMRGGLQMQGQYYDFASAEFGIIASRAGLGFEKAEKGHEIGFPLINTLFKNEMLTILDTPGSEVLVGEILTSRVDSKKEGDDAIDAFRYAISKIPWSFEGITGERLVHTKKQSKMPDERSLRPNHTPEEESDKWSPQAEIAEWNELIGVDEGDLQYDW